MADIEQVQLSMSGFEVNAYVAHAPEGDIIFDAGAESDRILDAVRQPVAAILITHGHADHIGALEELRAETGAPVYMHPADARSESFEPLSGGQDLLIAGEHIHVLHTPGHSPGSVTFVLDGDQVVGDLVLPGSVGRTDLAGGSWDDIETSLREVMPLWEEQTRLYCGHGPVLVAMEELQTNPYLPLGLI